MNSALLDHNTPEQVLHHVVNDPNISLADFRALTLAVVKSPPVCYFTAKGLERNKKDILSHVERYQSKSISPKLLFGVPVSAFGMDSLLAHESAKDNHTDAFNKFNNANLVHDDHQSADRNRASVRTSTHARRDPLG